MVTEDARVAKLLAEHYQAGVKEERERIMILIDNIPSVVNDRGWTEKIKRELKCVIVAKSVGGKGR